MYVLIIVFNYSVTNIVNFIFFLVLWESKMYKNIRLLYHNVYPIYLLCSIQFQV